MTAEALSIAAALTRLVLRTAAGWRRSADNRSLVAVLQLRSTATFTTVRHAICSFIRAQFAPLYDRQATDKSVRSVVLETAIERYRALTCVMLLLASHCRALQTIICRRDRRKILRPTAAAGF